MRYLRLQFILLLLSIVCAATLHSQSSIIRGSVIDNEDGSAIMFGDVCIVGTDYGTTTDETGFYSLTNIPSGKYEVVASYIGYVSDTLTVDVGEHEIKNLSFSLGKG